MFFAGNKKRPLKKVVFLAKFSGLRGFAPPIVRRSCEDAIHPNLLAHPHIVKMWGVQRGRGFGFLSIKNHGIIKLC